MPEIPKIDRAPPRPRVPAFLCDANGEPHEARIALWCQFAGHAMAALVFAGTQPDNEHLTDDATVAEQAFHTAAAMLDRFDEIMKGTP